VNYRFLRPALKEVHEAASFYELQVPDLGREFINEFRATVERILAHPEAWAILEGDFRRCRLRRFPYAVIYLIEVDHILIVAVMHLHRKPESWKKNLNN